MQRFFFHRMDGHLEPDLEGTECADMAQVRREAVLYAAGTLSEHPEMVWTAGELQITVTNDTGAVVTIVTIVAPTARLPLALSDRLLWGSSPDGLPCGVNLLKSGDCSSP